MPASNKNTLSERIFNSNALVPKALFFRVKERNYAYSTWMTVRCKSWTGSPALAGLSVSYRRVMCSGDLVASKQARSFLCLALEQLRSTQPTMSTSNRPTLSGLYVGSGRLAAFTGSGSCQSTVAPGDFVARSG